MNAQRHLRIATIASIFLFLVLAGFALFAGTTQSIAARGNTGKALAYRAALAGGSKVKTLMTAFPQNPHRYVYDFKNFAPLASGNPYLTPNATTPGQVIIPEAVQTSDLFAPPPAFTPIAAGLTSQNLNPVWSPNEQYIVFSSNLPSKVAGDPTGKFHIWYAPADGGEPVQVTSGAGNEYEPTLSATSNKLAFTSDINAGAGGVRDLYITQFNPGTPPVATSTLRSVNVLSGIANPGFTNVTHPSWSRGGDELAFSALTNTGNDKTHYHIYYLFADSLGYYEPGKGTGLNPPGKLTAGLEDDHDPTWSPDGGYLLFSSNSAGFVNTNQPVDPIKQTTPVVSNAVAAHRSLFLLTNDGVVPSVANADLRSTGGRVTNSPTTDEGASWAFLKTDFEGYIAFARLSPTIPATNVLHYDIYYMPLISPQTGALSTEATSGVTKLDTSDPKNAFNDEYPTWSPLNKHYQIAYQSNRSITYNSATGAPLEVARSIPDGAEGVGVNYVGILLSQIRVFDPPTFRAFSGDEFVHTGKVGISTPNRQIVPGTPVVFTVRLSDRVAGLDDDNIYLQIKDPDSKYQDAQKLEHKLFTTDTQYALTHPDLYNLSASQYLYNGGYNRGNAFVRINNVNYTNRGALGGRDGDHFISVGRSGGGVNPATPGLPGSDPATYIPGGQEYECQFLNASFGAGGATDTKPTDYGTPLYLPGVDDVFPGSAPTPAPNWLKLTKATTQDALGGVLYTATWTTPISPSDYYLDVIAYNKSRNWRIFDNIWGFTTQKWSPQNNILVVSDYALGQKFVVSAFGRVTTQATVTPEFYGAESYFTGIDVDALPNAAYETAIGKANTGGKDPVSTKDPVRMVIDFGYRGPNDPQDEDITGFGPVENALGPGSEDPAALGYDIWRIICRGPIGADKLVAGYAPGEIEQPAVPKLKEPKATFKIANRCVVWVTPYSGNILAGPGTYSSSATQNDIATFLNAGGRLFVSGQTAASNSDPTFLSTYLASTSQGGVAGTDILAGAGGFGHRVSYEGTFNTNVGWPSITSVNDDGQYFFDFNKHPSDFPLILGNVALTPQGNFVDAARTDGSLNQHIAIDNRSFMYYGPVSLGGPFSLASAKIDTIAPDPTATTDITFGANNPAGLITHENAATGSRIVFSSFGLEGLGIEYHRIGNKWGDYFFPYNQRPHVMFNVATYLRTGSFSGRITKANGDGIPNALVYLSAGGGTIPGMPAGRTVYSDLTDGSGNYSILGVEPGSYKVTATKPGFKDANSSDTTYFLVEANRDTSIGLTMVAVPDITITGKVTYKTGEPVNGAHVEFTAFDGTVVSDDTDVTGTYVIGNVPSGDAPGVDYTGFAQKDAAKSASKTIQAITGTNVTTDFVLDAASSPGSLTGVVTNTAGTPLVGATVSATLTGATTSTTVTTKTGGVYSFPSLAPGVYKVTASFPPTYGAVTVQLTIAPSTVATHNFTLGVAKAAQLGGLITSASGTPLGGLTVTATPVGGGTAKTFVTSATATTSPLGTTTSDHGTKINWSGSLPEGIYDITVKSSGVTSTIESGFAVTAVKFNQTRDFAFASIHTFTAGLHMISSPYDYSGSLDSLFGANRSKLVIWQPKLLQYVLDPTPPADGLHPGYGYWIRLPNAVDITVAGAKPTGPDVSIALFPFWNQIGNPGTAPIPITELRFLNASHPDPNDALHILTYDQAKGINLISPTIYGYDQGSNAYVKVTALQPWEGYWIKVYSNTTVLLPVKTAVTTTP